MIIHKPFQLAASYTIGSYILPGQRINTITEKLDTQVKVAITSSYHIVEGVKSGKFDLGLIESPIFDNQLIYKEWLEDELVICSKVELPPFITPELFRNYNLICRKKDSPTREMIHNFFKKCGISYSSFKSLSEIHNETAAIQSIKWAKPNSINPTVTIISKYAIEDEVQRKELFQSHICNNDTLRHKFYIVYSQEKIKSDLVKSVINELGLMQNLF
jgi:DNA-binding transcriptional LysR family regulator